MSPHGRALGQPRRWLPLVSAFVCTVTAAALAAIGQAGAQAPGSTASVLEQNLSRNGSNAVVGEPEIAINPQNQAQLFVDWTTFPNPLKIGSTAPPPTKFPCGGLMSSDSGAHWSPATIPLAGCADAVAATGPGGVLYAGGISTNYTGLAPGGITVGGLPIIVHARDLVLRSTNWGRTWSAPVETMGSDAARFAQGGAPVDTFDRPWLAVDPSKGTVYASGANLVSHERFITASTNQARSFGAVYPVDSSSYPLDSQVGGGTIAAGHGVVAVAYVAGQAANASCPCVVFETSNDHGATFNRHLVPLTNAAASPRPFIAADPLASGRYALTVLDTTGTENQVYTTDDGGSTWNGPTLVGESPAVKQFKPWISYTSAGKLALAWRTSYSNNSYDVWAALGSDTPGSAPVFSSPVRVSSVAAPYPSSYVAGDDFSFVIGNSKYVNVGWGDSRSGNVQDWEGRVPVSAFASAT